MKKEGTRRCLHQDTKSLITPSLHLCFALRCFNMLFVCLFIMNALGKAKTAQHLDIQLPAKYVMLWSWKKQRCRDGVMSDFVCFGVGIFLFLPFS